MSLAFTADSQSLPASDAGQVMHDFVRELFPLCRSITGGGVRDTLAHIAKMIPLQVHEVPTGTHVLDWTVPKEWNIRAAYIKDSQGRTVIDFQNSNLHVVSYSLPVRKTLPLAELSLHVHTLPAHPHWIPYRTSYYEEAWGFCLTHEQFEALLDTEYEICIDSTLEDGSLSYGECVLRGATQDEILISSHVCHPSLANDNLSGIAVATFLARNLIGWDRRYTYRFLFIPGTIGSISWLARNQETTPRIRHGLVLAGVGDRGNLHYKRSRRGDAEVDRAVEHVIRRTANESAIMEFSPYGYDERQYCSPGFDLPVGCLMRTPWGQYPEYHTSADNLDLVRPESLADTLEKCLAICDLLERNETYRNLYPYGEPQLGRRGLYKRVGVESIPQDQAMAMLWVLNLSDGDHDLLAIADRACLSFSTVASAAASLEANGLLEPSAR